MLPILTLLFVVIPLVELYVLMQVGRAIGVLNTIAALFIVSIAGAWMMKRQGMSVIRAAKVQVNLGRVPAKEIIDGVMLVFAGALLLTPGFVTDVAGILLLLPPVRASTRAFARGVVFKRLIARGLRF